MPKSVYSDLAPEAIGPYSQAVISGGFVFVSGQLPFTPANEDLPETIEAEVHQSLTNIKHILEACGSSLEKVVRVGIFLTNLADFGRANEVYASFFKKPYPARVTVQVSALPKGARVEIDAIAEV
ncbi:MAG: Rid family detoxifying hydrolase [Deltaproteobacteria bacterium]|jgi:2-iminobutanoate/2-iminopropanoate deaminase|nr:Rid family detoxifying hydrolase [Deltaproteobacteria bacterium]